MLPLYTWGKNRVRIESSPELYGTSVGMELIDKPDDAMAFCVAQKF
jgi:hypothetical protein